MKKIIYICVLTLISACSVKEVNNCFKSSGRIMQLRLELPNFDKILVNRDVKLILKEGSEINVVIETGEHLLDNVETVVVGSELRLTDNNTCNYVRDFGITKVYVTAPNITNIRSSTQYEISSEGVLNYDNLKLISEDFNAPNKFNVGDFRMDVNSVNLVLTANNISSFYISGQTENLTVTFAAGAGRVEAKKLVAEHIKVFHRGSNDILVNPQKSISGELRGIGDVIGIYRPPIVAVEEFYIGQLIFEN